MELTQELIRKHKDRLIPLLDLDEVKAHSRRSKKGKIYQVNAFDRKVNKQVAQIIAAEKREKDAKKKKFLKKKKKKRYVRDTGDYGFPGGGHDPY